MLIVYCVAAVAGGLAALGGGWLSLGPVAILLAPLGASASVVLVALPAGLMRARPEPEHEFDDAAGQLVSALRGVAARAERTGWVGEERSRRHG